MLTDELPPARRPAEPVPCRDCGRLLRRPESIAAGRGPKCKARAAREITLKVGRAVADLQDNRLPGVTVAELELENPYPPSAL